MSCACDIVYYRQSIGKWEHGKEGYYGPFCKNNGLLHFRVLKGDYADKICDLLNESKSHRWNV